MLLRMRSWKTKRTLRARLNEIVVSGAFSLFPGLYFSMHQAPAGQAAASRNGKQTLRYSQSYRQPDRSEAAIVTKAPKPRGPHAHHHPPEAPQGRHRRSDRRRRIRHPDPARRCGRVHLALCQQQRGAAPDEPPPARGGGPDPRAIGRARRHPGVSQQPARRRYRHAVAIAHRRDPAVQPVRPHPLDLRAARLDQRHRLRVQGLRPGMERHGRRARRLHPRRDRQVRALRLRRHVGQRLSPDHQQHPCRSTRPRISRASRSACR